MAHVAVSRSFFLKHLTPSALFRHLGCTVGFRSDSLAAPSLLDASTTATARCQNPSLRPPTTMTIRYNRRRCPSRPFSLLAGSRSDIREVQGNTTGRISGSSGGGGGVCSFARVGRTASKRNLSSEIRRGTDLLADSLNHGERRKIVLESRAPSGFDVRGLAEIGDMPDEEQTAGEGQIVHLNGSVLSFPDACYLWRISGIKDVNADSLAAVALYSPSVEYLFIGSDRVLPPKMLDEIKLKFQGSGIVVEHMDVMNAMGTFNILNGEDRRVAAALVLEDDEKD